MGISFQADRGQDHRSECRGESCGCDLCILRGPACDGADADLLQRQLVALYRCADEDDTGEESQDHAHRL